MTRGVRKGGCSNLRMIAFMGVGRRKEVRGAEGRVTPVEGIG